MINVSVSSPGGILLSRSGHVDLNGIYLYDEFVIEFEMENGRLVVKLNLPEWLTHFTKFLRMGKNYDSLMSLSGDRFHGIYLEDGNVDIVFFDEVSKSKKNIVLTRDEAIELHETLYNELHNAIRDAVGSNVIVDNDNLIRLD
jgi:lipocalin